MPLRIQSAEDICLLYIRLNVQAYFDTVSKYSTLKQSENKKNIFLSINKSHRIIDIQFWGSTKILFEVFKRRTLTKELLISTFHLLYEQVCINR